MTVRKIYFCLSIYLRAHYWIAIDKTTDQLFHMEKGEEGGKTLAYLVYEYIDWNIQGTSLSVYHGDESKSHSHVEPLTVASSVQNLGFFLCLLRQLPGLFSTTFACPAWVEQDKKSVSLYCHTVHWKGGKKTTNKLLGSWGWGGEEIGKKNSKWLSPSFLLQKIFKMKRVKRGSGGWGRGTLCYRSHPLPRFCTYVYFFI